MPHVHTCGRARPCVNAEGLRAPSGGGGGSRRRIDEPTHLAVDQPAQREQQPGHRRETGNHQLRAPELVHQTACRHAQADERGRPDRRREQRGDREAAARHGREAEGQRQWRPQAFRVALQQADPHRVSCDHARQHARAALPLREAAQRARSVSTPQLEAHEVSRDRAPPHGKDRGHRVEPTQCGGVPCRNRERTSLDECVREEHDIEPARRAAGEPFQFLHDQPRPRIVCRPGWIGQTKELMVCISFSVAGHVRPQRRSAFLHCDPRAAGSDFRCRPPRRSVPGSEVANAPAAGHFPFDRPGITGRALSSPVVPCRCTCRRDGCRVGLRSWPTTDA